MVKNLPANAGDTRDGSFQSLGWKKSPEVGSGNPFPYSCLVNSMDRGARQAPVARSPAGLKTEHKKKNIIMGESYYETVLLNFCPWVCVCVSHSGMFNSLRSHGL